MVLELFPAGVDHFSCSFMQMKLPHLKRCQRIVRKFNLFFLNKNELINMHLRFGYIFAFKNKDDTWLVNFFIKFTADAFEI